jgi:hypothetical protein
VLEEDERKKNDGTEWNGVTRLAEETSNGTDEG